MAQVSTLDAETKKNMAIERVLADYGTQKYDEALEQLFELKDRYPSDPLILNLIGQRAFAAAGATVDQQNRHDLAGVNKRN